MRGQAARVAAATVALLGAVALIVVAVLLLTRGNEPAPVVIVAPEPTVVTERPEADITVQVSGAVMSPGVFVMGEDDRVMDAIAAAGGLLSDADLSSINLARRVQDEAHYHVPLLGETPAPPLDPTTANLGTRVDDGPESLVDLNSATTRELESLPGIGPVTAGRIIAHRDSNGPFATLDDVLDVHGIGPKTLDAVRLLVTVSGGP